MNMVSFDNALGKQEDWDIQKVKFSQIIDAVRNCSCQVIVVEIAEGETVNAKDVPMMKLVYGNHNIRKKTNYIQLDDIQGIIAKNTRPGTGRGAGPSELRPPFGLHVFQSNDLARIESEDGIRLSAQQKQCETEKRE